VVQQLREMNRRAADLLAGSNEDRADVFFAQQNARLVRNAEEYYRGMFHGRVSSWNMRDNHMVETLQALERHLQALTGQARMAVWAHNSHLGDASATEMGDLGEWNVGQLARDRWGDEAVLVGFSTHGGTVTAGVGLGCARRAQARAPGPAGQLRGPVPPRRRGALLAAAARQRGAGGAAEGPAAAAGDRRDLPAATERQSHYFHTRLPAQFDA
jgi:erythromycin esterase-like protein